MQLYQGPTSDFVEDAVQHELTLKLQMSFLQLMGHEPPQPEVNSWRNSLQDVAMQLATGKLLDTGIILEWHLALTSARIDCVLLGTGHAQSDAAVVIELKQWQEVWESEVDDCVETILNRSKQRVLHPSAQVRGYKEYLEDHYDVFYRESDRITLSACSYLHNFRGAQFTTLGDKKFTALLADYPLFDSGQSPMFQTFLRDRVGFGDGIRVLERVLSGNVRPNPKLMQHTAEVIKGNKIFKLIDDQVVAYQTIMTYAKAGVRSRKKAVVLVNGGPGTGKSVIALNVLAELSRLEIPANHATGSRAFTENLRKTVGRRAATQFKYFNTYKDAKADELDVLILDEAHRIRETSNNRFTKKAAQSDKSQIEELVSAAKVCVFFIDEKQRVRPDEVGSSELIAAAAKSAGAKLVRQDLHTQFRCAGSQEYIEWVDERLGITRPKGAIAKFENFDLRFFDSPLDLETAIRSKSAEGFTARLTAGFCWQWSDANPDGSLINDVRIGEYARPWNAKPESRRFAPNVPPSNYWATDARGIEQIGCIYTAQGFEFDYVGVIVGYDLVFRFGQGWLGQKEFSKDNFVKRRAKDEFAAYAQHVYRVLMTRGIKGCYVYFLDSETRQHFQNESGGG